MAHFAEIVNNVVQRVIFVHNNELLVDGVEVESKGAEFCTNLFGGQWLQTSFNARTNRFRKHYAGTGYTYDPVKDIFVEPKPYPSWTLDSNDLWQPPSPMPLDKNYIWDESQLKWVLTP
jgi:hypothetical protein